LEWGIIKKARQQRTRLEKKGIRTDATEAYKIAEENIRASSLSKAAKKAAMENAAKAFLSSGMTTVKQINARAAKLAAQSDYMADLVKQLKKKKDWKALANAVDQSDNQKAVIVARHFAYGAQQVINELVNARGWDKQVFYDMNARLSIEFMDRHADPDEISKYIYKMEDEMLNGTFYRK